MTIANTNVSTSYNANGVTREWNLGFHYDSTLSSFTILVTHADGTSTTVTTNYELDGNVLTYPTVESELDPLPLGDVITITRVTPLTQAINLVQQGPLDAETLESGYDKGVLISQELKEGLDRAIKFPPNSTESTDAQEYIDTLTALVDTATTQAQAATDQAGIATTQAGIATSKAELAAASEENAAASASDAADSAQEIEDLLDGLDVASIAAVADDLTNIDTVSANIASVNTAATNISAITSASTYAANAEKWAEGSDEEVTPLGGTHSAKGWANYVVSNAPTATITQTSTGATITTTDIVHGTTTATLTNGADGQDGAAATISVGTVSTGAAGSSATVTNSGTTSAAVFDFSIPQGAKGDTGNSGVAVSTTQPSDASINVWINPNGSATSCQTTANLVTSLSSSSTDTQYPSAKCVYDLIGDVETLINAL